MNDKFQGKTDEIVGSAKKNVGEAIGNDDLANEGRLQEAKGRARKLFGDIREKIEGAVDAAKNVVDRAGEK